jgi:predicted Zn-dependent peptidase
VAADGLRAGELERVQARIAAQLLRELDGVLGRTLALAALEQVHGRAELLFELPGLVGAVTADQVAAAASTLTPGRRAVVELVAAGAR